MANIIEVKKNGIVFNTHFRPHLDELAAIWTICKYGSKEFLAQYAKNDVIELGINGGVFDEHPRDGKEAKKDECCFTLVVKALGIESKPEMQNLIKFVFDADNGHDCCGGLSLATIIVQQYILRESKTTKKMAENKTTHLDLTMGWVEIAIDAAIENETEDFSVKNITELIAKKDSSLAEKWLAIFDAAMWYKKNELKKAKEEFEKKGVVKELTLSKNKTKIGYIKSDHDQMAVFGRHELNILIQQHSSGNVQIYSSNGISLDDVARIIHFREQEENGKIIVKDWKELGKDGNMKGTPWYYFRHGKMLFNGSQSYPDMPPTKLCLDEIVQIVEAGINPEYFHSKRHESCRAGVCTSTKSNTCPMYDFGLPRCRAVRHNAYKKGCGVTK